MEGKSKRPNLDPTTLLMICRVEKEPSDDTRTQPTIAQRMDMTSNLTITVETAQTEANFTINWQ